MPAFDDLVAAVTEADSEFRLSRIPHTVIRDGVLDCAARLKALEVRAAAPAEDAAQGHHETEAPAHAEEAPRIDAQPDHKGADQ